MSAETPGESAGTFARLRLRFRDWRGTRPFWAGLFTVLGGIPIAYFPYATLKLGHMSLAMATTAGAGSLIIGVLLVTLGLTMWFQSATRVFAGVAAILLALVSLVVSNIGGFLIGFLLALVGGALALSWVPGKPSSGATGDHHGSDAPAGQAAPGGIPEDPAAGPYFPAAPYEKGEDGETDGVRAAARDGGHRVG
ncbi:DUF6114 domain-containing protein [Streptomyces capillispiralis]|uniref:Integral membrane protein n=1 Tax=Streptomyces capillispiralis TaxID=68182 RepID=A0A561TDE3_9ACTN|nr:DUF6114 domain-containing protein [Streptomyces capillispiralis]TWF85146.1 hypothetical protein FHX78_112095 [Streptomyces capillispiralis]GHH90446.1 hypothetical protein GCM10017779_09030 [Streptomyces capillispiralis]